MLILTNTQCFPKPNQSGFLPKIIQPVAVYDENSDQCCFGSCWQSTHLIV